MLCMSSTILFIWQVKRALSEEVDGELRIACPFLYVVYMCSYIYVYVPMFLTREGRTILRSPLKNRNGRLGKQPWRSLD